jgi:predicted AAA+ superfamily ATPase
LSTPEFFFFDTGVRHAAAGGEPGRATVRANPGAIFEQWVGQELWKRIGYLQKGRLYHYRTKSGAEIDFIIEMGNTFIPVEVKWTEHPAAGDARHIIEFIKDMRGRSKKGFIVCRCARPMQIHEKVTAIPYWLL